MAAGGSDGWALCLAVDQNLTAASLAWLAILASTSVASRCYSVAEGATSPTLHHPTPTGLGAPTPAMPSCTTTWS